MRTPSFLLTLVALTCFAADGPQGAQQAPTEDRLGRLRAEASGLEHGHVSGLFVYLADREAGEQLNFSPAQVDLARRLDETGRSVLRSWLLRGLDKQPTPPSAESAGKLGEQWSELRKIVIAQTEAIALEAVLVPAQGRRVRSVVKLTAARPLSGRYFRLLSADEKPPQTAADLDWAVRSLAGKLNDPRFPASELFGILTSPEKGPLDLSAGQIELVRRLEEVTRAVCRGWLVRGLGDAPPKGNDPPSQDLMNRLSERGELLRASVVAHAELIALSAILSNDQAEIARRSLWRQRGVEALLDPELANRLRLSGQQREEVFERMVGRGQSIRGSVGEAIARSAGNLDLKLHGNIDQRNLADQLERKVGRDLDSSLVEADLMVLDALTSSQARALLQIMGKTATSRATSKSKRAGRPG
jgi:hypothetical protein